MEQYLTTVNAELEPLSEFVYITAPLLQMFNIVNRIA